MRIDEINKLIEPAVSALGLELLGCEQLASGKNARFRIFIDSPKGIDVEDCAEVSRQVTALFAVEAPNLFEAELEVSSPGLERPLFKENHFKQFIGKRAKVRIKRPINERRNFTGVIKSVVDGNVVLEVDGEDVTISVADMDKANLSPEF